MRYNVICWQNNDRADFAPNLPAEAALQFAYRFIGTSPFRSAHIYARNTVSDLYVARSTDLARVTLAECLAVLTAKEWR